MKTIKDVQSFAWHIVCEEALYAGWEMEGDMYSVFTEDRLQQVMYSRGEADVTIGDWVEASKGTFTEQFKAFWKAVYEHIQDQVKQGKELPGEHTPMLISCHSGSSDYFTYSMLKDFVKEL